MTHQERRDEIINKLMVEFNKDHNYDDTIPEDMKDILCHMISNNDWDGLTNFMRIGVDITRRECARRSADFILSEQSKAVEEVISPLEEANNIKIGLYDIKTERIS